MKEQPKDSVHWSTGERVAIVVLFSILVVFVTLFGIMIWAGSAGCGAFGPEPCPPTEALSSISYVVNSPTNTTLKIINSGSVPVSLISYSVSNANGQAYTRSNWTGPTVSPNAVATINIVIDGSAFTFQSGYSYAVYIVTSRNNRFGFTFQA